MHVPRCYLQRNLNLSQSVVHVIKEAMLYVLISGFSLTVTTFASTVELTDMGFRINGTVLLPARTENKFKLYSIYKFSISNLHINANKWKNCLVDKK